MFKNYFLTTLRSMQRRKGYVLINVLGLAVGMACCLLIGLYVYEENSVDRFHTKGNRIYRVLADVTSAGETNLNDYTPGILGPLLIREFPEIEESIRLTGFGPLLRYQDRQFQERNGLLADQGFFNMFSFPLLQGDPSTALAEPFSIVLTTEAAERYFGHEDPMGKTITGELDFSLTVTGIVEVPKASMLQFRDFVVPMAAIEPTAPVWQFQQWFSFNLQTFAMLREEGDAPALSAKFPAFLSVHAGEAMQQADQTLTLSLEPLYDIYLRSERSGVGTQGNLRNLYLFTSIAFFILFLACINFTNLATARSVERAREVGVRKLVGAHSRNLIVRFLGESCLLALTALPLAFLLAEISLPAFNAVAGKSLEVSTLAGPSVILIMILLALIVGLVAGFYPAFVLSRFAPAQILKGRFTASAAGSFLRQGLVVLQFGISIALITATLVVYTQLKYMQNQDLGFNLGSDDEQVLVINFGGDEQVRQSMETVKAQLLSLPAVHSISASQTTPGGGLPGAGGAIEDSTGVMRKANVNLYLVDFDFIDVYDLQVVAGRAFSETFAGDALETYILNETAARQYGFANPQDALGKKGVFWGREGTIIGVIKDFHHYGLNQQVTPTALRVDPNFATLLSLRVDTEHLPNTIQMLEAQWQTLAPQRPFGYTFLNEKFEAQYRAEYQFGQLFSVFAVLAIFIACLGLFGLASFTATQRTKEIGVRKVLGASIFQIIMLLSRDFTKLVFIAFLIGTPVAYLTMNAWLNTFPYRTSIGVGILLIAGGLALVAAISTVSYQAHKAAAANPTDALRCE